MSKCKNFFALASLTIGVCLLAGCGDAGNTVEMPANPAPPPTTGPAGATLEGDDTTEIISPTPSVTAPPAPNP